MNPETKICQNCKNNFVIEPEDFEFYQKINVPPPTFCPGCRMIRRFNFRNEGMLFRRKDAHDGKEIFSGFSPEANVLTYENNYWFGGEWDPLDNGLVYDFDKPFFEQFGILLSRAPLPARSVYNMVNSEYCNEASECKNSYLCFNADYLENSAYMRKTRRAKDCLDSYEIEDNELCYENVLVDKSYKTLFSLDCQSCVDVWFSKGLRGCTNCFGCVNLRNKSYYFFNEVCSKEEYIEKLKNFTSGSYKAVQDMHQRVVDFWLRFPDKFYHGLRVVDSTGERIFDSKNVKNSYYIKDAENLRFCQDIWAKTSNSYDYSVWGDGAENMYECMTCGLGCYNVKFCFNCWEEVHNLEYCAYCIGSKNCFGCAGLYKKEYCIFNKQYTKEEYFSLREKIINHMNKMPYVDQKGRIWKYGEFFPFDLSPLAYNESLAQDFFPINNEVALKSGFSWRDPNLREYETTLNSVDLPDNIKDVDDEVTKEVIKCVSCNKAYRLVPLELQFYRNIKLPLPKICHNCRFIKRFKLVNPPKLWHRKCQCSGHKSDNGVYQNTAEHFHKDGHCPNEFETSYAPERPEIVYCEQCYNPEVI